ncbi:MAG: phenylalanine 4-monooxygenase [Calditrichia bacterium]
MADEKKKPEESARDESLSAFEKAGLQGDDPRCKPIKLDKPAPEGDDIKYPDYSEEEQETWKILFERQLKLLPGHACQEYMDGLDMMEFPLDRIPYLGDVGRVLERTTNWQVARVPGLLFEGDFFSRLARRVFPSTDYIRPRHELDYTPAPDLFHDIFGHTPMITNRSFADFYQKIGEASLKAAGADRRRLERIYWFTVEFGLIDTPEGLRIYGNGIISSYSETQHSLTEKVEKRPFDPDQMAEQEYDVWHMQPLLYVIDSFEQLEQGFYKWAQDKNLL